MRLDAHDLKAAAGELVEFKRTGILGPGKVREFQAALLEEGYPSNVTLTLAVDTIKDFCVLKTHLNLGEKHV